jgi:outer membrane protein
MSNSSGRAASLWAALALALTVSARADAAVDLLTALQKALDQSPAYQTAQAQYRYDAEARPQALAKLLPQVGAQAQASFAKQHYSGTPVFADQVPPDFRKYLKIDSSDYYKAPQYAVGFTQALYHPADFIGFDQSKLQVVQAQVALDEARSGVMFKVAQNYLEVLQSRDNLRFAAARRDALRKQFEQGTVRHSAGLVNDADFAEIQSEYELSEAAVAQAQGALEVSLSMLASLTGESWTDLKILPDDVKLPAPDPDNVTAWVAQATEQNLTVIAGKLETRVAKLDYDKARASRLPVIDVIAGYAYEHPTGGYPGPHEATDEQIGLRIKQPIYSGGAIDSAIRGAQAKWEKAQAQEDQARAEAVQAVRAAFFEAKSGQQQIPALKQAIQAAITAEDATRVGYQVGTRTTADLLRAIGQRYQAEAGYSTARYQYLISTLQLKQSVGVLSSTDLQAINEWLR